MRSYWIWVDSKSSDGYLSKKRDMSHTQTERREHGKMGGDERDVPQAKGHLRLLDSGKVKERASLRDFRGSLALWTL